MSRLHHYSPDSSPLESLAAIAVSEPPALPSRHSSGPPLAVHLQQQHSPLLPTWLCTFSPVVNPWCVWVTWAAGSKNRASNLAQNAPLRHRPSQYITASFTSLNLCECICTVAQNSSYINFFSQQSSVRVRHSAPLWPNALQLCSGWLWAVRHDYDVTKKPLQLRMEAVGARRVRCTDRFKASGPWLGRKKVPGTLHDIKNPS